MSTQPRSSSGGVRNLRAMFEQKDESSTSPPDRGRSPAGSFVGGSNGTSPRPLSKVRTSFVTVERSGQFGGQLGLRKEGENDEAKVRTSSIDEETDPEAMAAKKTPTNPDTVSRKKNVTTSNTVSESATAATPPVEAATRTGYMNGNSAKATSLATKPNGSSENKNAAIGKASTGTDTIKVAAAISSPSKPSATKPANKPTPISTAKASAATKPPPSTMKSPPMPKTPTTPGKGGKPLPSKKSASKPSEHKSPERKPVKAAPTSSAPMTSARTTTSSAMAKNATKKATPAPSATGFVKPRPKSPTKPVKLPASLMAPTASSKSKVAGSTTPPPRQSLAPHAAVNPALKVASRSPSRVSLAPKIELRRTKSSIHSERPALGRPPTSTLRNQSSRQSLPKQVAPADEGFLARMMRPTTSSASKVAEKPVTPPRERAKSTTRPQTRDSTDSYKTHDGLKDSPSTRKLPVVPRLAKVEAPKLAKEEIEKAEASAENSISIPATSTDVQMADNPVPVTTIVGENPTAKLPTPTAPAVEILNEPTIAEERMPTVGFESTVSEENDPAKTPSAAAFSVTEGDLNRPSLASTESKVDTLSQEAEKPAVVEEIPKSADSDSAHALVSEAVLSDKDSTVESKKASMAVEPQGDANSGDPAKAGAS